jgi:hypothetical protein
MQSGGGTPEILSLLNYYSQQIKIYADYSDYLLEVFSTARESPEKLSQRFLYQPVKAIAREYGLTPD